ncbi:MAG: arylsulfatase [Cyclobacteriaceae bacterium]
MRNYILLLSIFGLFSCEPAKEKQVAKKQPNIIFIMADDLGYADVGPYGQKLIKTPNIDQLAKDGMTFTQFYAGTSVCAPSRAVLMTGLHTGHVEIRGNKQNGFANGQHPLSAGTITVGGLLQEAGYHTGMIGKWGLGNPGTEGDPLNHGFDHFFGYSDQVLAHNYYPEYLWRNGDKIYLDNQVHYLDTAQWHDGLGSYSVVKNEYSHDLFMNETLTYINDNKEKPFFLYLPFTIPHDNGEQADTMRFEVPTQGQYATEDWTKNAKDYAAMVSRLDKGVGEIVAELKKLKLEKNTLLIFTSDNGPMKNRQATSFFDSNGPLRGGKRDLYEGGMREPFIAYWPGKVKAGSSSDFIGAFWDMLPTFTELAGQPYKGDIDGISIVPTLLGSSKQEQHDYLYWEFHEGTGSQAIRQGKWKAVRVNAKTEPGNPLELYDLSADIGEQVNIVDQFPGKVQELDSLITASRTHSDLFPFTAN